MIADRRNTSRAPSATLVVDSNIALGVLLGRRSRPTFNAVLDRRKVITSARAAEEIRGVAQSDPRFPAGNAVLVESLFLEITVIAQSIYSDFTEAAEIALRQAVASRNGSTSDAHILACAWVFEADIWSHDRDFAGTGWPSWSNANLIGRLSEPSSD